ncbi:MAG: PAS domain-containing protein [Deltaproteobacteria bacterium]|nr:PAS domain-containing protein [Deltaproteobacteria bacterium]
MQLLLNSRSSRLNIEIAGVADINPEAPGICLARENGIFTTSDYHDFFNIDGINLIIELTGSAEITDKIAREKPARIFLIGHFSSQFLLELLRHEIETEELEKKWEKYIEWVRKQSKVIPDSIPYRIMVVNMDKSIETANKTFLNAYNLTEEDIYGKHCYELDLGPNRTRECSKKKGKCYIDEHLDEVREKGIFSTIEEYIDEKNQSRFDVITIAPICNDKGEVIQILEASRDVTDRIRLESEAQKSNTFLQNVIQSTVDGIVVVDTKGNVLIFNEGMERLTGFSSDEIINEGHLSSFYDIDLAKENMKKMRSENFGPPGKLNPTSMYIKTKSGEEIPVTLSASIIDIDNKEVGSVGIFTDMREILEMRKNLEDAHFQLVQSEKIASVGRMAAGVAHEINNPLSGIMIYAELIKKNLTNMGDENRQNISDIQEIIDQTLRCKKIVSELLEFSRQTVGKVTSFSIEELITKSLNLLINQALFQNVEVIKEIEPDMPPIAGDLGQLQQVLTNLFINAADAMEGKGQIKISAIFNRKREFFIIRIADTGPGIPDDLKDKIFDIFFTTKPVGKGTGLGLSITKNILQLHGGNIMVDSKPGKGTVFSIELPMGFVEHQVDKPVFIGLDE